MRPGCRRSSSLCFGAWPLNIATGSGTGFAQVRVNAELLAKTTRIECSATGETMLADACSEAERHVPVFAHRILSAVSQDTHDSFVLTLVVGGTP